MNQSPTNRPLQNVPDYKSRFGLGQSSAMASVAHTPLGKVTEMRPRQSAPQQQPRHGQRQGGGGRYPLSAVIISLLLGSAGAAAFFVGQDAPGFLKYFAASQEAKRAPSTGSVETAPAAEAMPVVQQAPAPTQAVAEEASANASPQVEAPVGEGLPETPVSPEEQTPLPAAVEPAPALAVPPIALAAEEEPVNQKPAKVVTAVAAATAIPIASPAQTTSTTVDVVAAQDSNTLDSGEGAAAEAIPPETPQATLPMASGAQQTAALVPAIQPTLQKAAPSAADIRAGYPLVPGQIFRDCSNCPELVVVVAPKTAQTEAVSVIQSSEYKPQQPFAIGRMEATFDDWAHCVADGGCTQNPKDEGWGRNTRPVINVSHDQIVAEYLPWLSRVTGVQYRLPSSAEWDHAALGVARQEGGNIVLTDATSLCQSGNFSDTVVPGPGEARCADGFPSTAPAGSLNPNQLGVHDMRGNVWEWVSDCWTPGFTYKVQASEKDCRRHRVRGGSWSSRATLTATALSGFEDAARAKNSIGFRVLRALP